MARRRRSSFVPWRVPGLKLYVDAESSAMTFGTGANIAQWNDISQEGSSHHPVQADGDKQAERVAAQQNGRAAVTFTQANADHFTLTDHAEIDNTLTTFFAVATPGHATNNETLWNQGSNNPYFVYYNGNPRDLLCRFKVSASNKTAVSGDMASAGTAMVNAYRYDQVNMEIYWNGASVGTTAETGAQDANTDTIFFGNASASSTNEGMSGDINAFLMWNVALSDTDMVKVSNYLNLRWAVY